MNKPFEPTFSYVRIMKDNFIISGLAILTVVGMRCIGMCTCPYDSFTGLVSLFTHVVFGWWLSSKIYVHMIKNKWMILDHLRWINK